jgi:hypothetical protein
MIQEDHHFYIDNAAMPEVETALRVLSLDRPLASAEIRDIGRRDFYYPMQKDATYAPKRLEDLGLAKKVGRLGYVLTLDGASLQSILQGDPGLAHELMHYRHFTGYAGHLDARKLMWSYRRCCELVWAAGRLLSAREVAGEILGEMQEQFATCLAGAGVEGQFKASAVTSVYSWLRHLESPRIDKDGFLCRCSLRVPALAGLALDDFYRNRGINCGDRVVLDNSVLDSLALVFFATPDSVFDGLRQISRTLHGPQMIETLSGTAIILNRPYGIRDV